MVEIAGKPPLRGSADPMFRGDPALYNPEDLLVAALAACSPSGVLSLQPHVDVGAGSALNLADNALIVLPQNTSSGVMIGAKPNKI